MNFIDLIIKKRDKLVLSRDEIEFFTDCAMDDTFPDYQLSAMLMAIYLNGLDFRETTDLTMAMVNSGNTLSLSKIPGIKVDKHSTGGVGDTTTLILAPLAASCGLPVVKMSGRGLGHTGGTIDKLESIPGFCVEISEKAAFDLAVKNNIVLMGQSKDLAPADKRLYAIRDVTGTVESIPLIASSIMSKKIASGCDAFVLDIKCGNGAFAKDLSSAENLARTMIEIGKSAGKKVAAVITDMNEPLGKNIGNALEVIEAIEILKGNIGGRLKEASIELGSIMLVLGGICKTREDARNKLEENIKNKKGLEKFRELIFSQNGNPGVIDDYSLFPAAKHKKIFEAKTSGYISGANAYNIGKAACETGAGRKRKDDIIDYGAGIVLKFSLGNKIEKGAVLAEIYASSENKCESALDILKKSIEISEKPPALKKTILKEIL